MNSTPFIVILATCGGQRLDRTLASLAKCQQPKDFRGVHVIENGTKSPHVEDLVVSYSQSLLATYQFVSDSNKSNALNTALEGLSENHFVFFTDDDVLFETEVLLAYQNAQEHHTTNTVFGGRVVADPEIPIPAELIPFLPSSHSGYPGANMKFDPKKHLFIGNNWAAYSDDIKQLGGFNPLFGPGSPIGSSGQESDMLMRMRDANYKLEFVSDAVVKHWVEKERLSREFTELRKFKVGIFSGVNYRHKFSKKQPVWKRMAIMLYHLIRATGLLVPSCLSLRLRMNASFSRGFLAGCFKNIPEYQNP